MRFALAALLLFALDPLEAQGDREPPASPTLARFPRGAVTEVVEARMDPQQRYAVYLPSRYTPERRWPLLLLMDPRGRALIPLKLVQESAERLGYVVLSSYNSRSDEAVDPNRDALNAMLVDAQRDYSLDERRFYLVGFSGTTRAGWEFARELSGYVAGLIGFGAGLPGGAPAPAPPGPAGPPFAVFSGAGVTDFNFDEVMRLDAALDRLQWPHRTVAYPGAHTWPDAPVLAEALGWMELQAMRSGLRPVDSAVVDSALAAERRAARGLEQDGRPLDALLRFRSIIAEFGTLHDMRGEVADTLRLHRTAPVREERQRRARLEERQFRYVGVLRQYFLALRQGRKIEPLTRALDHLEVPAAQKLAADRTDRDPFGEASAARRRLEHLFVMTVFYEPRERFAQHDPEGALAMLAIARAVHPEVAYICHEEARALAELGRITEALARLKCWTTSGVPTATELDADPDLSRLREEAEYIRLREAIGEGADSGQ